MRTRTKSGIAGLLALGLVAAGPVRAEEKPEAEVAPRAVPGWIGLVLQEKGTEVRVIDVVDGSPAEKAGIREDDVILEVDGGKVADAGALSAAVRALHPGDHVRLKLRRDGSELDQDVVVAGRPRHGGPMAWHDKRFGPGAWGGHSWMGPGSRVRLGVQLQPLTEGLRGYFHVGKDQGVLIADVAPGSPAERAGLKPGDVLVDVNGKAVASHGEVMEALAGVEPGTRVVVRVVRDGSERSLDVTVEERPKGEWGGFDPAQLQEKLGEIGPMIHQRVHEALEHAREELEKHRDEIDGAQEKLKKQLETFRIRLQTV